MTAPIVPLPGGGHLVALWERVRDGRLFFPFCERNAGGRRAGEPSLDAAEMHAEAADALLCGDAWPEIWASALAARLDPKRSGIIVTHGAEAPHRDRFGDLSRPWDEAVSALAG